MKAPSLKLQAPGKLQAHKPQGRHLKFGAWGFPEAWCLGFGAAILIMAASIRAGQSWDLRLPYASLRVTLRVGTQKQPTFMHLLTGLRLRHPPRGFTIQAVDPERSL